MKARHIAARASLRSYLRKRWVTYRGPLDSEWLSQCRGPDMLPKGRCPNAKPADPPLKNWTGEFGYMINTRFITSPLFRELQANAALATGPQIFPGARS